MQTLNLTLPTCWQELTPAQLRYVFYLLATDKFTAEEIKVYVMFRWAHIEVIAPEGDGFFVKHEGKPVRLTSLQIAEVLPFLSWLDRLPTYPVRLPQLCGHSAIAADLSGLSFGDYITCDNLYTGSQAGRIYLHLLLVCFCKGTLCTQLHPFLSYCLPCSGSRPPQASSGNGRCADPRTHERRYHKGAASPRYGRLARAHRARRPNG